MELVVVFLIGLGASFFGSFVTGGLALFSITGLLFVGLSPLMALGTFRLGSIGFTIGGMYKYIQAKKIVWSLVPLMTLAGVLGSIIGASLVLSVDESLLEKVIGVVILFFIPLSIFKPKLGLEERVVSAKSRFFGHVSYFLASIWGGSISIGTGLLAIYPLMHFYGLTLLQAKGTNRPPNLVKVVVVLLIFNHFGYIDWTIGLAFALGMLLGSYVGTHYAVELGDARLRIILLCFIALFSLKLILGL